jgi:hypothetical protein
LSFMAVSPSAIGKIMGRFSNQSHAFSRSLRHLVYV